MTSSNKLEFSASPGRLDAVLSVLSGVSRSQVVQWIDTGSVRVNSVVAGKAGLKLRGGEHLEVEVPAVNTGHVAPETVELDILYQDEHLIAVNKPPGMITHPAPGVYHGTLVNALLGLGALPEQEGARGPEGYRPGIVHRLDKDTSGVIVVAKTVSAHAALAAAFKERETRKTYLAVASGRWPAERPLRVDAPIGRHPIDRQRMTVGGIGSREAQTLFTPLAQLNSHGRTCTLVRCQPHTGRTHQIRVHLAHLGSPILGDTTYGRGSEVIGRQALHAWQLRLAHPVTGAELHLAAAPPEDLLSAWLALGGGLPPELTGNESLD